VTGNWRTEADGWQPQFEGQRPPFAEGSRANELGLRHGAWSPRRTDPLALEMIKQLLADDDVAYLRAPKWGPAVWSWARCEARIQLITEYLIDLVGAGHLGDLEDPKVSAAYRLLDRFEAQAVQRRGRLGLDPLSAARLGRNRAAGVDVAKLMAVLAEQDEDDEDQDA
jgi:hypothetical protein